MRAHGRCGTPRNRALARCLLLASCRRCFRVVGPVQAAPEKDEGSMLPTYPLPHLPDRPLPSFVPRAGVKLRAHWNPMVKSGGTAPALKIASHGRRRLPLRPSYFSPSSSHFPPCRTTVTGHSRHALAALAAATNTSQPSSALYVNNNNTRTPSRRYSSGVSTTRAGAAFV